MMGSVVIDEHVIPVVEVRLEDGLIIIKAEFEPDPDREPYILHLSGQPYRVHGSDGTLIGNGVLPTTDNEAELVTPDMNGSFWVRWDVTIRVDA